MKYRPKFQTPNLTKHQATVLAYVIECVQKQGYPPTHREVAKHFGYRAINSATTQINALVKKGALLRDAAKSRGLRLPESVLPWHLSTANGEALRLVWSNL